MNLHEQTMEHTKASADLLISMVREERAILTATIKKLRAENMTLKAESLSFRRHLAATIEKLHAENATLKAENHRLTAGRDG